MIRRTMFAIALSLAAQAAAAATQPPLQLEVYNRGAAAMFPVSSEIVSGQRHAVLIDAQLQRSDALALVARLKAGGKQLTTVYVSHSDPDYYFGLDVIHAAFPHAKIVASAPTVAAIKLLMQRKLAYWGPLLKTNAPQALVVPEVLKGDRIELEGRALLIEGLHGPTPARSYVWIPSLKTVVGGAVVFSGTHVWVADTPTPQALAQWQKALDTIRALKPERVVPGHYLGAAPAGLDAIDFTSGYLDTFQRKVATTDNADALIRAMQASYPGLPEQAWLELGAKVWKGELRWPQ